MPQDSKPKKKIPINKREWSRDYGKLTVEEKSLRGILSGSRISMEHVLCLRVLHNFGHSPKTNEFFLANWVSALGTVNGMENVSQLLKVVSSKSNDPVTNTSTNNKRQFSSIDFSKAPYFVCFLSHQNRLEGVDKFEGEVQAYFSPAVTRSRTAALREPETPTRRPSRRVISTDLPPIATPWPLAPPPEAENPSPGTETPASDETRSPFGTVDKIIERLEQVARDESTVEHCFLALLVGFYVGHSQSPIAKDMVDAFKEQFTCDLGTVKFTACVDGLIRHHHSSYLIIGLIEVKKCPRSTAVRIQEAAELVAFISSNSFKFKKDQQRMYVHLISFVSSLLALEPDCFESNSMSSLCSFDINSYSCLSN